MKKNKKFYKEINQELFERIERYLLNQMSERDRLNFEKEMAQDEMLRNEVSLQEQLQAGIAVDAIGEEYQQDNPELSLTKEYRKSSFRPWLFKIAAALIIIAIPVYFLFFNQSDLYNKYYEPDPGLPTEMGLTNNYDFLDGMVDYKRENYKIAQRKWSKLMEINPDNDTLNYYLAMANLNLKSYTSAKEKLDKISPNSAFYHDALWFQSLLLIKNKDYDGAKEKLHELDSEKARELLKELP